VQTVNQWPILVVDKGSPREHSFADHLEYSSLKRDIPQKAAPKSSLLLLFVQAKRRLRAQCKLWLDTVKEAP